jgi:hypothetical protein
MRGILASDHDRHPQYLSLVTFPVPSGRGLEGERLVCAGDSDGIARWRSSIF